MNASGIVAAEHQVGGTLDGCSVYNFIADCVVSMKF
jgi:hypothetical protein